MGFRNDNRHPLAWQKTLGDMKRQGVRLVFCCTARGCDAWLPQSLGELIAEYGDEASLWDERPRCASCGKPGHYMASPGASTPFTPMLTGMLRDAERRAFLRQFGFTTRDIARIRRRAEETTSNYVPAALNDLDVPFRVGFVAAGAENRTTGQPLGQWKGRQLVYWPLTGRELKAWQQRRPGPRAI